MQERVGRYHLEPRDLAGLAQVGFQGKAARDTKVGRVDRVGQDRIGQVANSRCRSLCYHGC